MVIKEEEEGINNPQHYQGKGMTVIDVIRAFDLGFELGNAFKYIARCEKKGDKKKDLLKAIRNIEFELDEMSPTDQPE